VMDRYGPMNTSGTMATGAAGTTPPSIVGTEHQATNLSTDRIVAVFENSEKARVAREALIAAQIDNASMDLLSNRSDLDNWSALKRHAVPDEDTHLYAEGLGRGHSILVIRTPASEHDHVMQVLSRFTPIDIDDHASKWRQAGWSGVHTGKAAWDVQRVGPAATTVTTRPAATAPAQTGTETNEQVIPVYEEELKVGKRVVEDGNVRVRVYTAEHPVQEGVTLREERVAVERRPVDLPAAGMAGETFQDRTIDVTTHREEPVIEKEARVKEEIVVRKEADQHTETVRDNLRRTEVEVEDGRAKTPTPAAPTTPRH
jgi:uncharacterized protein (TIGR02271 family)